MEDAANNLNRLRKMVECTSLEHIITKNVISNRPQINRNTTNALQIKEQQIYPDWFESNISICKAIEERESKIEIEICIFAQMNILFFSFSVLLRHF